MPHPRFQPGQRVRVTQLVPRLEREGAGPMTSIVEGVVVRAYQSKTGSWYAHSKDGKLWLDRLELKKDDGEMVVVNLDQHSQVEILSDVARAG